MPLLFLLSLLACPAWAGGIGAPWPGFAGRFLSAYVAEQRGDWPNVASQLEALTEIDATNPDFLHRLALVHLNAGEFDRAVEVAHRLAAMKPDTDLAQVLLYAEDVRAGDMTAARTAAEALGAEGLGQYLKPFLLAWLAATPEEAKAALQPIAGLDSLGALYQQQMAIILEKADKPEAASAAWLKAVAAYPSYRMVVLAISYDQRRQLPARVRALRDAARSSSMDDELVRALDAVGPSDGVETVSEGVAEVLYGISALMQAEGAGDVALPYLQIALALRPDFAVARLLAGDLLVRGGRYEEARQNFAAVATDKALGPQAGLRLGVLESVTGKVSEAVASMQALTNERSNWSELWQQLGDAKLLSGDLTGAIAALTRGLTLVPPDSHPEDRARMLFSRARALNLQQDLHRAELDLEEAARISPDNAVVLNHLGYLWAERGVRLDEAAGMISRALQLDPDNASILDSLGWVRFRQGAQDEAVRLLEMSSELRPYDPVINDHLGDAYWAVGRVEEARFQWQRAATYRDEPGEGVISIDELRAKIERGPAVQMSAERHDVQN